MVDAARPRVLRARHRNYWRNGGHNWAGRSRFKNLKELRPGSSGRSERRMLFAFDSQRTAIVLVAGDKSGDWSRWYKTNIPTAEDLFAEHEKALKEEDHGKTHG